MPLIRFLYLDTFIFIVYFICSMPITYPLMQHEVILGYFSIEVTHDIRTIVHVVFGVVLLSVLALAHNASKLIVYFGCSVEDAMLTPLVYIKGRFGK